MIEVRVTVPQEVLNVDKVRAEILKELKHTEFDMRTKFLATTGSWKEKVSFVGQIIDSRSLLAARVSTFNRIYALVNAGSPPHGPIRPKRARMLRFQGSFTPKSRPRLLKSWSGGKFGDWVSVPIVHHHPGFEAREFDQAVADEIGPGFEERIQEAIARGSV